MVKLIKKVIDKTVKSEPSSQQISQLISGLVLIILFILTLKPVQAKGLPDLSQITFTEQDLPGDIPWQKCGENKLLEVQESFKELGIQPTTVFCFGTSEPLRIMSGFTLILPDQEKQAEFDKKFSLSIQGSSHSTSKYDWIPDHTSVPPADQYFNIFRKSQLGVYISSYIATGSELGIRKEDIGYSLAKRVEDAVERLESARKFAGSGSNIQPNQNRSTKVPSVASNLHSLQAKVNPQGGIIFNYNYNLLSQKRVSDTDLKGYNALSLDLLRNAIFARHGRKFVTPALQNYFNGQSWYKPRYTPEKFPNSLLTSIELDNVNTILQYQQRNGLRYF
jgi:hypothetical protein